MGRSKVSQLYTQETWLIRALGSVQFTDMDSLRLGPRALTLETELWKP